MISILQDFTQCRLRSEIANVGVEAVSQQDTRVESPEAKIFVFSAKATEEEIAQKNQEESEESAPVLQAIPAHTTGEDSLRSDPLQGSLHETATGPTVEGPTKTSPQYLGGIKILHKASKVPAVETQDKIVQKVATQQPPTLPVRNQDAKNSVQGEQGRNKETRWEVRQRITNGWKAAMNNPLCVQRNVDRFKKLEDDVSKEKYPEINKDVPLTEDRVKDLASPNSRGLL
ncbi:hypothetical protein R1sor_022514 [Riccia sorocarpa]|uniref:Uncharacterized protein n=1 Tax=Riccia sorocarpa TaxID=122646 RepID=A0ABD3GK25_9MARC